MIKAVIFDLDGLLVDSQHLQYKATNTAFSERGYPIKREDWRFWIHEGMRFIKWIELNNLPLKVEELRTRKREIYDHFIETELELKPGAKSLIDLLHGKFRLAIASSSRIESIDLCVDKFNLRSKFEYLISDFTLNESKPHPEVFLNVAKIMNVKPESCLVIEDSASDLKAAHDAGIGFIAVTTGLYSDEDFKKNGAKIIIKNIREVVKKVI